ncbi:Ig-like domain-containing protein [Staphylococcus simulans]|uniref:Ig-like domain-containing protein n=1 Tax=Staphylococcus simulans TaxID=1286 RepID=UPI0039996547
MPRKQQHDVLFDKELRNKYHIRKFSAGIASVLFGTLIYTSLDQQAQAAENTDTTVVNPTTQPETNSDTAKAQTKETVPTATNETINNAPASQDATTQQPPVDHQTSETAKPEPVTAPEVSQPATTAAKDTATTQSQPAVQPEAPKVATRAATTTDAPAQPITNTSAPAPAANAHPVAKIEGINEQVYAKEIPVYEKSEVARTAKMQRGIYHARESLGLIVPANKKLYIRQAQGSNEADLRVDLMTNDKPEIRNANVSKDGSWTQVSATMDSAAFLRIPTGLAKKPVVEYYVEGDAGVTLPTYRKGGDKAAFDADWAARNTSYGYVDGDKIAFLIPNVDRERIANLGQNPGRWGFMNLEDMIAYYEDVINHYDKWVGLNDDINSVHYNVGQKYFAIADAHGPGLAYYSTNNMGSNNPSMSGYLERGWLALHEVGHGYDGAMTYDPKMNLIEVENNILANEYQTKIMGVNDGWAYGNNQEGIQKEFHDKVTSGEMNFYNGGFRGNLDFMTKMVRLTGIEGFTDLWKGIRQEEADMNAAGKPFEQDVPRWITTFWLAKNGINGTAYFDLYKVQMPQSLKDDLDTYNNTFTYPLASLITNPAEQQRIKEKLGLATIYELVNSSDLADTTVHENAQVSVNLNGQVLPDNVKVSLMEGTQEVASAEVVDGKAVFSNLRAGVYKIVAPLSTTNALPESEYLVVKEGADNQATLDYPKKDDVQNNVTQSISIRGISSWEMASVSYNPDTKQVTYKQNTGKPHVYFTDEYAHVTIQKADGTTVLDKSLIGNQSLASELQKFDLEYGDKVIVRHREPVGRRALVRNETKDNVTLSKENTERETLTYTLTDKGFIVDGETQADANRRFDEAIRADVTRVAEAIKNHPERDYRRELFKALTGLEFADPAIKEELLQTLNPLVAVYQVDTPTVNPVEAGATEISGTGEPESTITLTFANGKTAEVEVDKNGQWTTQLPEGTSLEHNDVTQVFATGKHGTVSEPINVKVSDTLAPKAPAINPIEAGTKTVSGTSEPLSTVKLTLPDGTIKTVKADDKGVWTTEVDTALAHDAVVKAVASDVANNKSTEATQTVKDTQVPTVPTINPIDAGSKTVSGTSEPLSTVTLTLPDGTTKAVKADDKGVWTTEVETPFTHDAIIKAVASDVANNQSPEATQTVKDTQVPAVPTINPIEAGTKTVSGTSEPLSTVTLTLPDGTTKTVKADDKGVWTTEVETALTHEAVIKAVASDVANNQSPEAIQTVKDTKVPTVPTINAIESGTKTVSGTSEPLSTVTLTLPDGTTKTVKADEKGNWTAETDTPFTHDAVIKAIASDVANNQSPEATQTVKDTKVPATPTINAVEAGTKTVSGTSEPLSTVTLTLPDGSTKVVKADDKGVWTTEVETLLAHDAVIKVVASDVANNQSPEAIQTVKDTQAPAVPTINPIEAGTKTVSGTSEPLSTVTLTLPDGTMKTVKADDKGIWTTEVETPLAHDAVIKAVASDVANNQSPEATQIVKDTKVPTIPTINPIEAGSKTVSGTSEPLSTVTLTLPDGSTKVVKAYAEGNWTAELDTPFTHDAVIKAVASDVANNQSPEATQTVKDTKVPAVPTINPIEAGIKVVSGTSEPLSTVTLTLPDGSTKVVKADDKGVWTTEVETPLAHDAVIKAVASDVANNQSPEATQTVKDTKAPAVPTINPIEAGSKTVSGTSEPLNTVTLTLPDGSTKVVKADDKGVWTTEVETPFTHDAVVKAVASDVANNQSPEATQTVKDTKVPAVPTINPVEAGAKTVSGTSEPLNTVTLTLPDGTTKTVKADDKGVWTTEVETPLTHEAVIKAVASDVANNQSPEAIQTVKDTKVPTVPTINTVEAGTKVVSGTSEPLNTVTLTLPDGSTKAVKADEKGAWTTEVETPLAHDAVIKAVASDVANNQSPEATQTVKDTKAPAAPVVNGIKSTDQSISGTAEANSNVFVVLANGNVLNAKADAQGNWKVELLDSQSLVGNESVKAYAKDLADNQSETVEGKVELVEVPVEPEVPETEVPTEPTPGESAEVTPTEPEIPVEEVPEALEEPETEVPTAPTSEVCEEVTPTEPEIPVEEVSEASEAPETEVPTAPTPEESEVVTPTESEVPVEEVPEVSEAPETEVPTAPTPEESEVVTPTESEVPVEEVPEVSEAPEAEVPTAPTSEVCEEQEAETSTESETESTPVVLEDESTDEEETSLETSLDENTAISKEEKANVSNETSDKKLDEVVSGSSQDEPKNEKESPVKHDDQVKKATSLNAKTPAKQGVSKHNERTLPKTGNEPSSMPLLGSLLTLFGLGFIARRFNNNEKTDK